MGPNVEVVSFDRFDRPNQIPSFLALESYFGNHHGVGGTEEEQPRIQRIAGDSCINARNYKKECHFLHGSSSEFISWFLVSSMHVSCPLFTQIMCVLHRLHNQQFG